MALKVKNMNPIASLQSYYFIKANRKKFASKPYTHSPIKGIKEVEDNRHNLKSSEERFLVYYPAQYIDEYVNPKVIRNALETNPKITQILKEHGITPQISNKNIDKQAKEHMFTTYLYARDIAKKINLDDKKIKPLCQAALLHDIGKALIPEEIIQKTSKLTPQERKIIDLHSEIGYEILKTTDIPKEVSELVRGHHKGKDERKDNILSMILSVADVFSALKETRPYRPAMVDKEAFDNMVATPKLSLVFTYILRGCRSKQPNAEKISKE